MKVFCTGVTGYIGGDGFYAVAEAHPDWEFTCLVRNSDKGAKIASKYPKVRLVYGTLDDAGLLTEEAEKADIVMNWANADHPVAAEALIKGLAARQSQSYLIHTSGTGILLFTDDDRGVYGEASDYVYNDWDGLQEVTSIPDHAPHRNVDKIILGAADINPSIKTAIVCPPTIYGQGRGPDNQRSHQVPELSRATLELGHGIMVGAGKTFWTSVHVHDLSNVYLKLADAAADGGKPATWGREGYYFTENGDIVWGQVSQWVATAAKDQGFIADDKVTSIDKERAGELTGSGHRLWGGNSRARAIRARRLLNWEPRQQSLKDEVPRTVEFEARKLGKAPTHAAIAAGKA